MVGVWYVIFFNLVLNLLKTALDLAKRRKEGLDVLALLSQDNIR